LADDPTSPAASHEHVHAQDQQRGWEHSSTEAKKLTVNISRSLTA